MKKAVDFIKKVREAEPAVRKIWLVLFSAAAMALIVGIWALYTNNRLSQISQSVSGIAQVVADPAPKDKESPLAIFSAGLKTIFGGLKDKIGKSNYVIIEKPDFAVENLKAIPKTNLP